MYVNCQGALAIKIWPGIFILKNCEVHQNQKNGTKQPNGYILSAYENVVVFLRDSILDKVELIKRRMNNKNMGVIKWADLYFGLREKREWRRRNVAGVA